MLIGSMKLKATISVVIAMVDTTTSKAVTSDISKTASSIADRGCIWVKSKGSRSTTDSGTSWGGFVVLLNLLLVLYISTYCCPVNFKTVEKSGSSERLEGCGNYREPFFSEFGLASRSWIPPPAPTSAPSALTSTPNARVLHARPAFFVFCLHLFTTRP